MREIGHFIGGKAGQGRLRPAAATCSIPIPARCRPRSRFASKAEVEQAIANAAAAQPAWAATNPQRRARVMFKFLELIQARIRRPRAAALLRARQDLRRRQGRHPARPRSGRVRLRHPASAEGRIHRRRRPRHRPLFGAPAARRRRRHHAVQFPGHDPAVEMRARDRLRQRVHPQAVGARSVGADADRRAVPQGRAAGGHPQRRQRRQGSGRHPADRSARQGDRLRRLVRDRASTSIRPAARTESACSASAAPRTT